MQQTTTYTVLNGELVRSRRKRPAIDHEKSTYPETDLHARPEDNVFAVGVCFQVFHSENADDLDDGDEEPEREQTDQEYLLLGLKLQLPQDREREGDDDDI